MEAVEWSVWLHGIPTCGVVVAVVLSQVMVCGRLCGTSGLAVVW